MTASVDTIAAIATAPGAGGIGVVRLSGPDALHIAETLCATGLQPRLARYVRFAPPGEAAIDDGIALWFKAPASYTGEDVVELQSHGSPAVLQQLLAGCCRLGARMARAGEFSERAFLNGKLDLAQAEAVADLIAATDAVSARAARRALDGAFSEQVDALAAQLLAIRIQVEAAIDFADEPLDTAHGDALAAALRQAIETHARLLRSAEQGQRLRDGLHAVIVGPPNAGKSSLLNALAGSDRAIVTEVAGTTRDLLREQVRVGGIELTLVDTAGLRDGGDAIEQEGMRRARAELVRADLAIVVLDASEPDDGRQAVLPAIADVPQRLWVYNKADLLEDPASPINPRGSHDLPLPPHAGEGWNGGADPHTSSPDRDAQTLHVSARTGEGLDRLTARLQAIATGDPAGAGDGTFTARARQVDALRRAGRSLAMAADALHHDASELAAESLRQAHDELGEITGRVTPDDLLGSIFSTFCIGK